MTEATIQNTTKIAVAFVAIFCATVACLYVWRTVEQNRDDREQYKNKLAAAELVENADVATVALDENGIVVFFNSAAEDLLKVKASKAKGYGILWMMRGEGAEKHRAKMAAAFKSGGSRRASILLCTVYTWTGQPFEAVIVASISKARGKFVAVAKIVKIDNVSDQSVFRSDLETRLENLEHVIEEKLKVEPSDVFEKLDRVLERLPDPEGE